MRRRDPFPLAVSFLLLAGLVVVASISLASCGQGPATHESLSFTTIDFPGTTETVLQHLNASGDIVGFYFDSLGLPHGFLLQGGSFSTFDFPGAVDTASEGINDSIEITGAYDDSSQVTHGFLRQPDGSVVTIAPPDTGYTEANDINNSGTIAGYYIVNSAQGFQFSNGNYSTIDVPGATKTYVSGINNLGDICGSYVDASGVNHGFAMSNGIVTTLDFPGATTECTKHQRQRGNRG